MARLRDVRREVEAVAMKVFLSTPYANFAAIMVGGQCAGCSLGTLPKSSWHCCHRLLLVYKGEGKSSRPVWTLLWQDIVSRITFLQKGQLRENDVVVGLVVQCSCRR